MSEMVERHSLTEDEITGLRWMVKCNRARIGFLGPTVRKKGAMSVYDELVTRRLARVVDYPGSGDEAGYWILRAGRDALSSLDIPSA